VAHDSRCGVNCDSVHIAVIALDLSGVDAGADFEPEVVRSLGHRQRRADRPRRSIEGREEAVREIVRLLGRVDRLEISAVSGRCAGLVVRTCGF